MNRVTNVRRRTIRQGQFVLKWNDVRRRFETGMQRDVDMRHAVTTRVHEDYHQALTIEDIEHK